MPRPIPLALAGLLALSASAAAQTTFDLVSINVPPGATWQLNKPVFVVFDLAVDPGSVNANTIRLRDTDGVPAAGEFFLFDPVTVGSRVIFDLAPGGAPYDPTAPKPALDFLRLPFRF